MDIAELNQRITLLEHRTVKDEIGNHTTKWEETFSLWARVTVKTASETIDAGVTKEVRTVTFTVRQSSYLLFINSTTHRIMFRGQVYNIISVKPDYEHNGYMTISCETKMAGVHDDFY